MAALPGAEHTAAGLVAGVGRIGAGAPDMEPDAGFDPQLSRAATDRDGSSPLVLSTDRVDHSMAPETRTNHRTPQFWL